MEAAAAAAGFLALIQAFKGTVDSYLLFESFFYDQDESGLRDLALLYHIECQNLENWGDRCNIRATNPEDCLLFHESDHVKQLVLDIVERIRKLHDEAKGLMEIHSADQVQVDSDIVSSASKLVEKISIKPGGAALGGQLRARRSQRRRVRWAIKNKEKFSDIVETLQRYNEGLEKLLDGRTKSTLEITLPGRVLTAINDVRCLKALDNLRGQENALFHHVASLKALELSSDGSLTADVNTLSTSDFVFGVPKPGPLLTTSTASTRSVGIYKKTQRVWIEWKLIDETLTESQATKSVERLRTLSKMLSAQSTQRLHTAQCIGVVQEETSSLRLGLAFQIPLEYSMATPTTLLEIIEGSAANEPNFMAEPPLGHKFALARQLASSIALFHASQWLHRAFRSDNILFFGDITKPNALLDPYISGFESAREITSESLGYRPTGSGPVDYFYHPSSVDGFNKPRDLYSFGVVLLEIAYWRPLRAKIQKARAQSSLHEIQRLFVKSAKNQLPAMTGSIYAEVVARCLECALPDETDEDFTCAMSIEVISKLESCHA